ncbi:MAG: Spo0E family sporulation regulatory protein-aspartic acid phosphatase [Clostridium sp.]|nr:Spo0E family sporulation regulatory protein-aspartic acid phosphatase [Clostridium sp.]
MSKNKFRKKIRIKRALLNFLLNYLPLNSKLILYISQDLDTIISQYQKCIYRKHLRKNLRSNQLKKVA